jgi:hypothetical protein
LVASWKRVFRDVLSLLILSEVISNIRIKRRQAKIVTSESSRYAQHPGARGRAIMSLIIQQTFLILASKIVRFRRSSKLAAASLGQVHKATLRETGDVVAVKVQRPFLRKIYDQDLQLLTTVAKWMDKMPSKSKNVGGIASSWTKIFEDAEEIIYREMDYRDEAEKALRFAKDFGLGLAGKPIPTAAETRNNQTLPSAADWIQEMVDLDCVPAPDTNFFHIGGSSLLASQLASRIRKQYEVSFAGADVFRQNTRRPCSYPALLMPCIISDEAKKRVGFDEAKKN